jgi:hypothetical protein
MSLEKQFLPNSENSGLGICKYLRLAATAICYALKYKRNIACCATQYSVLKRLVVPKDSTSAYRS